MEKINRRGQFGKLTTIFKWICERTSKWRNGCVFEGSSQLFLLWCCRKTIYFGSWTCEKLHHRNVRRVDPPIQEQCSDIDRGRRRIRGALPKQELSKVPYIQTVNCEQQGQKLLHWENSAKWGSRILGKWVYENFGIKPGHVQSNCVLRCLSSQPHQNMILIISIHLFIYHYRNQV